ncbi:GH25 family lysozyme [Mesorhizobium marinum]|uniref:glycoside hydrolase family 25 protein n=1 Tax=Mesorhizobium marinum TaxID=3228790 RepID=UPI003F5B316B
MLFLVAVGALAGAVAAGASDFSEPWKRSDRALVIDAYEYNPIDWQKLVGDKRITGFINKASDGLSPPYKCSGNRTEERLCKALWKRHAVARELFHTRRTVAKALGLKWGAYHLGRPGNPIDQANNFIDFAEPGPDDLIALDIEDNDPEKWMSLKDAEIFARHIHTRLGRWPVLYTNGSTALFIAENRERYTVLSRLPLWYARYKPAIGLHFPKGYWQTYALWQFAAGVNCDTRSCPYRVPGTPLDIDVNVASMSPAELRAAWPFGGLVDKSEPTDEDVVAQTSSETVPLPVPRRTALAGGDITVKFAEVTLTDEPSDAPIREALAAGSFPELVPIAFAAPQSAEAVTEEIADITVPTGETIPLPIRREEARKKRGDTTLKFVAVVEVLPGSAATRGLPPPFHALLGLSSEERVPVELAGYAEVAQRARPPMPRPAADPAPKGQPSGEISAAALDDPPPIVPGAADSYLSRRELPVFLLRKLDGPDEVMP